MKTVKLSGEAVKNCNLVAQTEKRKNVYFNTFKESEFLMFYPLN